MGKKEKILLILGFIILGGAIGVITLPLLLMILNIFISKKGEIGILVAISLRWGSFAGMTVGAIVGMIIALFIIKRYKK